MTLEKTLHISKITNSPSPSTVTFKGETFSVFKCIVQDLETLLLPKPSLSTNLYQGAVIVHDISNNTFGYFLLITANPSSSSGSDSLGNLLDAREVWIARPSTGFIDSELQRSGVANLFSIVTPLLNNSIAFLPIRGDNPENADSIIPFGATNGVVS